MGAPGWRGAGLARFSACPCGRGLCKAAAFSVDVHKFALCKRFAEAAVGFCSRRWTGFRSHSGLVWVCQCSLVWVYAGLLLSALVVCVSWIFSLSLLATVRGSTSFLCKRAKKRSKETRSNHRQVSVPSVQARSFWHLIARCSQDSRMFEPLLLSNPDTNTLRSQRSRASTASHRP